ncbi:MAG: hypothetical protein M1839_004151 [Geoglossum umbratile]|nr:MAG: hypothetical protein M1839_004151 [Geoglossum umbratile]
MSRTNDFARMHSQDPPVPHIPPELLGIIYSTLSIFFLPVLEAKLGATTKGYAMFVLALLLEETKLLLVFRVLGLFHISASLYRFFGVWHFTALVGPVVRFTVGSMSDDQFIGRMGAREWQILIYFGPQVAKTVVPVVWSFGYVFVRAALTGLAILMVAPKRLRVVFGRYILGPLVRCWVFVSEHELIHLHGIVMLANHYFSHPFDRWEIKDARERRRVRPNLPYVYQSLNHSRQIRILVLNRRSLFKEPTCEIIHVRLDDAPPFQALSYTWGTKPPSIPITVDGKDIFVTSNVEEFLFHQRSIFRSKYFWIDAICIKQDDDEEKGAQIRLMAEIYRKATEVLVWLGPSKSFRETRGLHLMLQLISLSGALRTAGAPSGFLETALSDEIGLKALGDMFNNPWFERMWIIQEVTVGDPILVMCHGLRVGWDVISKAATELSQDQRLLQKLNGLTWAVPHDARVGLESAANSPEDTRWHCAWRLGWIRSKYQIREPQALTLGSLLMLTRLFKSEKPKDKVFALCGFASDGGELALDYRDSDEVVFLKATRFALSKDDWFQMLVGAGRGFEAISSPAKFHKGPSWVADYSSDAIAGSRMYSYSETGRADRSARPKATPDPGAIILQFCAFDIIAYVGPKSSIQQPARLSEERLLAIHTRNREWCVQSRELALRFSAASKISAEVAEQEFWMTCLEGHFREEVVAQSEFPPPQETLQSLQFVLTHTPEELSEDPNLLDPQRRRELQLLMHRFGRVTLGRSFAISSSGKMALVPPLSQAGDLIVHVRGGFAPLLVRTDKPEQRVAELVGVCSVRGVCDVYEGSGWTEWRLI